MAIAFTRAKIISRAKGQSAVACAAYRAGEALEDERYGKTHNYKRKEKILYTGLERPDGAPNWNRQQLWNEVERSEKRKDSQLSKEFIIALPHELSKENQKDIVQEISKYLTEQGMYADWAIHGAPKHGDKRNIHAHILTTMRGVTSNGFGDKNREWNKKEWLKDFRKKTLDIINERLENKLEFVENSVKGLPKSHHYGPARYNTLRRIETERLELNTAIKEIDEKIKAEHIEVEKTRSKVQPQNQPATKIEVKKPEQPKPQPSYEPYSIQHMIITAQQLQKVAESGQPTEAYREWKQYYNQAIDKQKPIVESMIEKRNAEHRAKYNRIGNDFRVYETTHPEMYQKPQKQLPDKPPLFGKNEYDKLKEQWENYQAGLRIRNKAIEEQTAIKRIIENSKSQHIIDHNAKTIVDTWIDKYKIRPIIDFIAKLAKAQKIDRANERPTDRSR